MHNTEQGAVLVAMARGAIEQAFDAQPAPGRLPTGPQESGQAWLQAWGGTFVTLTRQERLRGCIGTLEAWRSLQDDVQSNALAAAFQDPRFEPLQPRELPQTRVEVSVLSTPEPMAFTSEADALGQMRPGIDGIVLEHGRHRSTFLPQVWEQLEDPVVFMSHLKQKARLPADFWAQDLRLKRYTVTKWKECT